MQQSLNPLLIRLQALHQVQLEAHHRIRQDANAVQQIANHQRLEHVEFELAAHATDGSSDMVAHDLSADHGQGFTLRRVDLARHDGGTRLVLRQDQFAETAARAGAEVSDILRDLEQRTRERVKGAGSLDDGVVRGQNLELVRRGLEFRAGQLGNFLSDAFRKALEGVQARADGGTALREETEVRQAGLDTLNAAVQLGDVTGELLAKCQRRSVLQMGAADLDNLLESIDLLLKRIAQAGESREQGVLEFQDGGNVHDGGEGVVGGGGHVDVVVGVDRLLGAHLAAEDLNGAVGDDFVGVHVGLSAGAGLPDDEREVVDELEGSDFGSGFLDSLANLGVCTDSISLVVLPPVSNSTYQGRSAC